MADRAVDCTIASEGGIPSGDRFNLMIAPRIFLLRTPWLPNAQTQQGDTVSYVL